ncbi:carboxypeptidase regulatory-like domain-containing protein [Streptomyces sp. NPDC051243]|uniref:carboxypeptidase regulatory-like domain-containing protein n=1 Tax=Streptomyces sp. NPDC051243 TaxID=3365646 RepID=UPI0037B299B9
MSRSWKTTVLGSLALALAGVVCGAGVTYGTEGATESAGSVGSAGSAGPLGRGLWAAATIEPGREGIVEVGGHEGAGLGAGSTLTLTAPALAKVTGTPVAALEYRGSVAQGGATGTYTFTGTPASEAWAGRTLPFVLSVAPEAEPGTRLPDCALVLRDANGTVRERGTCAVTVGLPAPTLYHPQAGVPLKGTPRMYGSAYPGAQVTVRDAAENEVCATTTAPNGMWTCVPARALTPGPGRLQATATLNGVSATSEQVHITVKGTPRTRR